MATKGIKIKVGPFRVSYPNLFEPRAMEPGDKPKYSVAMLFQKSDTKSIPMIRKAIEAAWKEAFPTIKMPAAFKNPVIHDGDIEKPDKEGYADTYYVNAKTERRPDVVDSQGNPLAPDEMYPGCFARASVVVKAYEHKTGGKGVTCYLGNVMKTGDGDQLGGGSSNAADDFVDEFCEAPDLLG